MPNSHGSNGLETVVDVVVIDTAVFISMAKPFKSKMFYKYARKMHTNEGNSRDMFSKLMCSLMSAGLCFSRRP